MNTLKGLGKTDDKSDEKDTEEKIEENKGDNPNLPDGESFAKSAPASDENEPKGLESLEEAEAAAKHASANPETQEAVAEQTALDSVGDQSDSKGQTYTSHPVGRFRIGRFQFEAGTLTLEGDDVDEFEKLMENASPRDRSLVRRVNVESAETIARNFREGSMNRGIDTSRSSDNAPRA